MSNERHHMPTWQFLENVSDGVVITTTEGIVRYINSAAQKSLGIVRIPQTNTVPLSEIMPVPSWEQILTANSSTHLLTYNSHWQIKAIPVQADGEQFIQVNITPVETSGSTPAKEINTFEQLYRLGQAVSRQDTFHNKVQTLINGMRMAGWNRVTLSLRNPDFSARRLFSAGLTAEEHAFLHENMLSAEQWRQRFADEQFLRFRHGASVFIAADEPWAQTNIGVLLPGHEVPRPTLIRTTGTQTIYC